MFVQSGIMRVNKIGAIGQEKFNSNGHKSSIKRKEFKVNDTEKLEEKSFKEIFNEVMNRQNT